MFNEELKSVDSFVDSIQIRLLLLYLFRLTVGELLALHSLLNLKRLLVFFGIVSSFFVELLNVWMGPSGIILEG